MSGRAARLLQLAAWLLVAPGLVATGCSPEQRSTAPNYECTEAGCGCTPGHADCDGTLDNGCEVVLATDGQHCDRCGHDCLGGACEQGECQPVSIAAVRDQDSGADYLTVGERRIYWVDDNALFGWPDENGSPFVLASGQDRPACTTVHGGYVYWRSGTSLMRAPEDGGALEEILVHPSLDSWPAYFDVPYNRACMAPTSEHLYWIHRPASVEYEIWRLPYGPGPPEQIAIVSTGVLQSIAAGGDDVYWTNMYDIWHSPSGASPAQIYNQGSGIDELCADGVRTYWIDRNDQTVRAMEPTALEPTVLASDQAYPITITVLDATLCWGNENGGAVVCSALDGGQAQELAAGQGSIHSLTLSDAALFWLTGTDVMMLAR